jgi:glycosyltransferase involved in cell wall biosynthesis
MILEILWTVFLSAAAIQFVYLLFIFGRLSFFQPPAASVDPENTMAEGVSIVVAARNEIHNLKKLLPLLASQQYPRFEILIVNDRSTDGTPLFLRKMMNLSPNLRTVTIKYTPDHVTGKKYALTLGIKVAKYDIILLTDADCLPASLHWVQWMSRPLRTDRDKKVVLGYSAYKRQAGLLNRLIQYETLITGIQYFSFALWKIPFMGVGRNLAYRKSFFMENKAFSGHWHINGGDDDLFVNRHADGNNTAVVIHPDGLTISKPKGNWKEFFTQKTRHFHAGKYYKFSSKLKLGLYAVSHLLFWISGIFLLFTSSGWEPIAIILGLVVSRALFQVFVLNGAKNKLEGRGNVYWMMFFDLLHLSYFWIIGTKGYLSKKIKWK